MQRVTRWHISIPIVQITPLTLSFNLYYSLLHSSNSDEDVRQLPFKTRHTHRLYFNIDVLDRIICARQWAKMLQCCRNYLHFRAKVLQDIWYRVKLLLFHCIPVLLNSTIFLALKGCCEEILLLQCGHKGVALTQLFKPFNRQPSSRTNCLWCNWGLRPLRKAYIGLYVEMFKEQWISISGCKIAFGASSAC